MILITIGCGNLKEAKKIGLALLKNKLIACYNIWPVQSGYFCKKKLFQGQEINLEVKTLEKNYQKIVKFVKGYHSYKVPYIMKIKPKKVDKLFLDWVRKETK
jgi:periplasmic divalent cation tolerance protein